MHNLPDLSQLLLLLYEGAYVVLTLNVVHGRWQSHEGDYGVGFDCPFSAGHDVEHECHAVVDGSRTPQVLMRQHVQQLHSVLRLLLLLLHVLKLRLLLKYELKSEELLCLVNECLVNTLAVDDVLYGDRLLIDFLVGLNLLELSLIHDCN